MSDVNFLMVVNPLQNEIEIERERLYSSLLEFTQTFYFLRTGRKFEVTQPVGRESHIISVCRALVKVITGETKRLIIRIPPRYGKTELLIHFIAWAKAQFPDGNDIYTSYSKGLAQKQTKTVRQIINSPAYRDLFGVSVSEDVSAQANFETNYGGTVYAAGVGGEITGRGAGIQYGTRYGGGLFIDDPHKPTEVASDIMRESVVDWFFNTVLSRLNDPENTPIVGIAQATHERDLFQVLIEMGGWETLILPALDEVGNALNPRMHSVAKLKIMQETMPYEFAAQYQQNPQPAGGGIFKPEWVVLMDEEPKFLATYLTVDTAETEKAHNDATAFSFWGLHKITYQGVDVDLYGLHWIACREIRVEPKDLQSEFMDFWAGCMRHTSPPRLIGIEKKSTGVTMSSILNELPGMRIIDIKRNKEDLVPVSKVDRFLSIQHYVANKQISLPRYGKHTHMCVEHLRKITANNSHAHDDIADTLYDGVKLGLIDQIVLANSSLSNKNSDKILRTVNKLKQIQTFKDTLYGSR